MHNASNFAKFWNSSNETTSLRHTWKNSSLFEFRVHQPPTLTRHYPTLTYKIPWQVDYTYLLWWRFCARIQTHNLLTFMILREYYPPYIYFYHIRWLKEVQISSIIVRSPETIEIHIFASSCVKLKLEKLKSHLYHLKRYGYVFVEEPEVPFSGTSKKMFNLSKVF